MQAEMADMQRLDEPTKDIGATVVTIGNFDGVHRGHQSLISLSQELARAKHLRLVVMTFDPHPRQVLARGNEPHQVITDLDDKLAILAGLEVPYVRVLPFTTEFSQIPAERFLVEELANRLQAECVVVGEDFSFGQGARGTAQTLAAWGAATGIEVVIAEPVFDHSGEKISSSRVREAIRIGDMDRAMALLGRPFTLRTPIVSGAGRGAQMGVPTANMEIGSDRLMPPFGIYAGLAWITPAVTMPAVASWGVRPTFGDLKRPLLEVHVIGHHQDFVGEMLHFGFLRRLRDEQKYDRTEDLVRQMHVDIAEANACYHASPWGSPGV